MAHCPPELLDDLTALFTEVRGWRGVIEKTRGVFYVRRAPFLGEHTEEILKTIVGMNDDEIQAARQQGAI